MGRFVLPQAAPQPAMPQSPLMGGSPPQQPLVSPGRFVPAQAGARGPRPLQPMQPRGRPSGGMFAGPQGALTAGNLTGQLSRFGGRLFDSPTLSGLGQGIGSATSLAGGAMDLSQGRYVSGGLKLAGGGIQGAAALNSLRAAQGAPPVVPVSALNTAGAIAGGLGAAYSMYEGAKNDQGMQVAAAVPAMASSAAALAGASAMAATGIGLIGLPLAIGAYFDAMDPTYNQKQKLVQGFNVGDMERMQITGTMVPQILQHARTPEEVEYVRKETLRFLEHRFGGPESAKQVSGGAEPVTRMRDAINAMADAQLQRLPTLQDASGVTLTPDADTPYQYGQYNLKNPFRITPKTSMIHGWTGLESGGTSGGHILERRDPVDIEEPRSLSGWARRAGLGSGEEGLDRESLKRAFQTATKFQNVINYNPLFAGDTADLIRPMGTLPEIAWLGRNAEGDFYKQQLMSDALTRMTKSLNLAPNQALGLPRLQQLLNEQAAADMLNYLGPEWRQEHAPSGNLSPLALTQLLSTLEQQRAEKAYQRENYSYSG